jgi:hypothetical protein
MSQLSVQLALAGGGRFHDSNMPDVGGRVQSSGPFWSTALLRLGF